MSRNSDPAAMLVGTVGSADIPEWVPVDHPAREVLRNTCGSKVRQKGKGVECASSDIQFKLLDRRFYCDTIAEWEGLLETTLIGIADVADGHGELYMASDGRCYGLSCIHDAFWFEGETIDEAVHRLIAGLRSRPMILPGQVSVALWGDTFDRDSPQIYHPQTLSYSAAKTQKSTA